MGATVLVIVDGSTNRAWLARAVAETGCDAVVVHDAHAGLTAARQLDPTLIVMDLGLTDLDGIEVIGRLRNSPATAHTPILAVDTADSGDEPAHCAGSERAVEALEAGADAALPAPCDPRLLQARLRALLRHARRHRSMVQEVRQAEAAQRMALAATQGDLDDACAEIVGALQRQGAVDHAALFLFDDAGILHGPFGLAGVPPSEVAIALVLEQHVDLAPVMCGDAPWVRLPTDALGPLGTGVPSDETVVLALRHGEAAVALAVLATATERGRPVRDAELRSLERLSDSAAFALATAVERARRDEAERRFRVLVDQGVDGMVVVDPLRDCCVEVNAVVARWLSALPAGLVNRPFVHLFDLDSRPAARDLLAAAVIGRRTSPTLLHLQDGEQQRPVEVTAQRVRSDFGVSVVVNLREPFDVVTPAARELAAQAREVGHEINNILTCLIGVAEMLQLRMADRNEVQPGLQTIVENAERISAATKRLRAMCRTAVGDDDIPINGLRRFEHA